MRGKQLLEILSSNIRRIRNEMKYSQSELAEHAGISTGYMCDIENSKKWPGAEKLASLASVLKVQPYQLFLPNVDSPPLESHQALSYFSRSIKMAMVNTVDEVLEDIMESYGPSQDEKNDEDQPRGH